MFTVAGLDGADNSNCRNIGTAEGAIVRDVFHARTAIGDDLGEAREPTGTITDPRVKSREATIADESTFDDSTEHRWIDVSSTNS